MGATPDPQPASPPPRILQVGDAAELTRIIDEPMVSWFAEVTGDRNPVHLDERYAASTPFGRRIAHGMLVAGTISAVLGTRLPGPGAVYLGQTLQFRAPVFLGEAITARVEVIKVREDKPVITLRTTCRNARGELVIEGEAVLLAPRPGPAAPAPSPG
jgi:3-hydroxybutyryl-CoA dehydratase